MKHSKKLTAGLGVITAGLLGTGIAFAAWTSTASGSGSAASTADVESDITAVTPVEADDLYPGAVKSAFVTITNNNPYPVEVTQIAAGYSAAVGTPACPAATVRTDQLGDGTVALAAEDAETVIAGGGAKTFELVLRMSNTATDACKDKTFVLGGNSTDGTGDIVANLRSAATANGF